MSAQRWITIRLDEPWDECCICGCDTPMTHAVAYCCEPTYDEIGQKSSVYQGEIVGGKTACRPCHDKHYGFAKDTDHD